jgi:ParB/RepB/Spo0J family partition protein
MNSTLTDLPIEQLCESPFQPRQIYRGIDELATTIAQQGILQPLLARPQSALMPHHARLESDAKYELIFGHRRLRAAEQAGLATVPVRVVAMTDAEVRAAQAVENLARADVHPLEEAQSYRMMIDAGDATADQLAERFGKSRSHIYSRLSLLNATAAVREACLKGEIGAETVVLLTRLRTEKLQTKALDYIKGKGLELQDGGKRSYRRIRELLAEHFTLDIKKAMFDPEDASLVLDAGTCSACPKRTGNAPEYEDLAQPREKGYYYGGHANRGEPNLCTDPDCWAAKVKAHLARKAAAIEAKGKTVVTGTKARQAISAQGELKQGYVPLADVRAALKKAKGAEPQVLTILDPRTGKTTEAVKADDLKAAGIKPPADKRAARHAFDDEKWRKQQEENNRKVATEMQRREALFLQVHAAAAAAPRSAADLLPVVQRLLHRVTHARTTPLYTAWQVKDGHALLKLVPDMDADALARLALDIVVLEDMECHYAAGIKDTGKALAAAAARYGVTESQTSGQTPPAAARAPKNAAAGKPKAAAKAKPKPAKKKVQTKDAGDDVAVEPERDPNTLDMFEGAEA